ncbi:MAG: GSCFA domain-containing protein [Muribaculaceae bacterium]|nr:GSCFA domain-containing protein [Muribaculaceae bacterium]
MKFRTEYTPRPAAFSLSPLCPVVMLGSCFSENIAGCMRNSLWDAVNPCGTLYNPVSIANALELFLFSESFEDDAESSLFLHTDGFWHSFLFDSKVCRMSKEETLSAIEERRKLINEKLKDAQALFITFGTSIVYALKDPQRFSPGIVSNCHKLPSDRFSRFRMSVSEIANLWIGLAEKIRNLFPGLNIVFTVSPVRHLKDGFEGNSHSKAVLLLAVEEICETLPFCSYFPAYEILNDDLRDYRFYSSDLTHPSTQAVDYIWQLFKDTYINKEGLILLTEGEKLMKGYKHCPLVATDNQRAEYKMKVEQKLQDFLRDHPGMRFPG